MTTFGQEQQQYFLRVNRPQFYWLTQNSYINKKEQQLLLKILRAKPKKILEIGCGEGANFVNLHGLGFKGEMTGVDFSAAKIAFAKKHVPYSKFITANAYELPFKKEQFDLVFCKNLLHHLTNREKAVGEMARVCQRGGKIVLIESNRENLIVQGFGRLFKAEAGTLDSSKKSLMGLVFQQQLLVLKDVTTDEPWNLYRVFFHYQYGLPGLARFTNFWLKTEQFFSRFIPKQQSAYLILTAQKLAQPRPLITLRGEEEKIHFHQVFNQRKGSSWWVYATAAGKERIKRRGTIAAGLIPRQAKILEIGSGLGEFTRQLLRTGAQITGLEVTPELVWKAKSLIKSPQVVFQQGDVHQLPYQDSHFDFIVGNAVLHHLDLPKALPELKRVLKNKGKIIFFEPNLANPLVFLQKKVGLFRKIFEESPHETAFFRWSIKSTLEQAGFKNVNILPFDFLYPLLPKKIIRIVKRIEPFLEKKPLIRELAGSLIIQAEVIKTTTSKVRNYWDKNPLFSLEIKEKPGSLKYFQKIDSIKENEVERFSLNLYQFSKVKGKKVLDAGCGPGFLTRMMIRAGAQVTAIDLSPVAIKLTGQSLKILNLKGNVQVANLEKLPFGPESFDQVVSIGVIHHTPNPARAVSEIARVTKRGGRVVMAVYFLNFWLSPLIFPLTKLALKILAVNPPGRESMLEAETPQDFIRQYDGIKNPLAWTKSKKDWKDLIDRYFEIERIEPHFFPGRFILGQQKLPQLLAWFLDHYFGTMLYFTLKKRVG